MSDATEVEPTRPRRRRNASVPSLVDGLRPADFARFGGVVRRLRRSEPSGWRALRDLLLAQYEVFRNDMPGYAVLKAAMEAQRQAAMCEVASDRARTKDDVEKYREFQQYLAGEVDLGAGPEAPVPPVAVRVSSAVADAPSNDESVTSETEEDD